jgi:tetratricopeptide (TPR) repeat protein
MLHVRSQRPVQTAWIGLVIAWGALAGCESGVKTTELKMIDAERAFDKGDYAAAATAIDQYLTSDPSAEDRAAALYLKALVDVRVGRRADAYADARTAASLSKSGDTSWRANFVLGTLHFEDGDWASASRAYEAALRVGPAVSPLDVALFRTGQCLERLGRWSESRVRFAEVARRFPRSNLAEAARRRASLNASQFAIQCGVFSARPNAETYMGTLRQARLQPYVLSERKNGADAYVVLVGRYGRYEEAQRALQDVARVVNQPVIWP